MKNSTDFLPEHKNNDLRELVSLIREQVRDVVMIILYGSYAKNAYVDCEMRRDYGVKTFYMSDYDLLVVTRKRLGEIEGDVFSRIKDRFLENKQAEFYTKPQFINESISKLNHALSEGRYFYVDIAQEGVMLYDSGEYRLSVPRTLNYSEIKVLAQGYYEQKFTEAYQFLETARFDYQKQWYALSAFQLHQAAENYLRTIPLVYILYGYKDHDLELLTGYCKNYAPELAEVFPRDTAEEKRLFNLLRDAYVQARYNPEFIVTKADIDALLEKIELLHKNTEKVCRARMDYYDDLESEAAGRK